MILLPELLHGITHLPLTAPCKRADNAGLIAVLLISVIVNTNRGGCLASYKHGAGNFGKREVLVITCLCFFPIQYVLLLVMIYSLF